MNVPPMARPRADAGACTADGGCQCADGDKQECGRNVGNCVAGIRRCVHGKWSECDGVGPQEEICDGDDNDCDGAVDEGCDCEDGDTQGCGKTLGDCVGGTQKCDRGKWGLCNDVGPKSEICDGEDNDCDGDIDEGCDCKDRDQLDCGKTLGTCVAGKQTCAGGKWGSCDDVGPKPEICDGEDNDCDGDIDEDCDCRPTATRWCHGGDGVCQSGLQTCDASGAWGPCTPVQAAGAEVCDGKDNDCDGVVDNGFDLDVACNAAGACPQSRVCATDGRSSHCANDPNLYSNETCDGVDNDCDGLVDRVVESGTIRSVCTCQTKPLTIGDAVDVSVKGAVNLCAHTTCGPDRPLRLSVDGSCYPVCLTASDPDGDGWGFENGSSCLVKTSPRGQAASLCPGDGIPTGMSITYCLDCSGTGALPYAMCQSVPQYDLTSFQKGVVWLKVDYTFNSSTVARAPVNLWFNTGAGRKRLPLVKVGDAPGRQTRFLRADEACFTPSSSFGASCPGSGARCPQCGDTEVCGALSACGAYDLTQAWIQVAAEFCVRGTGAQSGNVVVNEVALVEPNCGD